MTEEIKTTDKLTENDQKVNRCRTQAIKWKPTSNNSHHRERLLLQLWWERRHTRKEQDAQQQKNKER